MLKQSFLLLLVFEFTCESYLMLKIKLNYTELEHMQLRGRKAPWKFDTVLPTNDENC